MIHIFDPYIRLRAGTDCHITPGSVSIAVAADCHLSGTGQLMILGLDRSRPVAHSDIFIRLYAGFRTDSNRVIDGPCRCQLGNPFHITGQADRIFIPGFLQIAGFGGSTESDGIITACLGIITDGHDAFLSSFSSSPVTSGFVLVAFSRVNALASRPIDSEPAPSAWALLPMAVVLTSLAVAALPIATEDGPLPMLSFPTETEEPPLALAELPTATPFWTEWSVYGDPYCLPFPIPHCCR